MVVLACFPSRNLAGWNAWKRILMNPAMSWAPAQKDLGARSLLPDSEKVCRVVYALGMPWKKSVDEETTPDRTHLKHHSSTLGRTNSEPAASGLSCHPRAAAELDLPWRLWPLWQPLPGPLLWSQFYGQHRRYALQVWLCLDDLERPQHASNVLFTRS